MKGIWVFNLKKWKPLLFICIASLFVASWLFIQRDHISVFTTPDGPQAFYRAENADHKIALTFNISWGEQNVRPIVNILKENDVEHATFFVSASWAETYPELVKEIADSGFHIGSHGYRYKNYTAMDDEQVIKDMRRSKQVLQELTGEAPTLLRPPNGAFTTRTLALAEQQGFDIVHWSVNSYDYKNPGTAQIIDNVLNATHSGDVLMFHASDTVKQTGAALPTILKELEKRDYELATLEELMNSADATSNEVN